jgi:hypothetical protein
MVLPVIGKPLQNRGDVARFDQPHTFSTTDTAVTYIDRESKGRRR